MSDATPSAFDPIVTVESSECWHTMRLAEKKLATVRRRAAENAAEWDKRIGVIEAEVKAAKKAVAKYLEPGDES